jgi:hypothetical protein
MELRPLRGQILPLRGVGDDVAGEGLLREARRSRPEHDHLLDVGLHDQQGVGQDDEGLEMLAFLSKTREAGERRLELARARAVALGHGQAHDVAGDLQVLEKERAAEAAADLRVRDRQVVGVEEVLGGELPVGFDLVLRGAMNTSKGGASPERFTKTMSRQTVLRRGMRPRSARSASLGPAAASVRSKWGADSKRPSRPKLQPW